MADNIEEVIIVKDEDKMPPPMPTGMQTRFRVETMAEQQGWKDSGLTFANPISAESWAIDWVPKNLSWRIMFETLNVVKFYEYKAPYIT